MQVSSPRTPAPEVFCAIDFETFYDSKNGYGLKQQTMWEYTQDPRFDAFLVSVHGQDKDRNDIEFAGDPMEFDWSRLEGVTLICHNAAFDGLVLRRLRELGKVVCGEHEFVDTADLAAFLRGPRNLKGAAHWLLHVELSKAVRESMDGQRFRELLPSVRDEWIKYAGDDAKYTYQLWVEFGQMWPRQERLISKYNREAGWHGVAVDKAELGKGIQTLFTVLRTAEESMPWVAEGQPAGSAPALRRYARAANMDDVPASLKRDDPVMVAWVEKHKDTHPFIGARLDHSSATPHYARLMSMNRLLDSEGVIRFDVLYHGANCLDGDHEVLTRNGWVRLDQWNGGEIAQWRKDNGNIAFLPAKANCFENVEATKIVADAPYYKASMTLGHKVPYFRYGTSIAKEMSAKELSTRGTTKVPVGGHLCGQGSITETEMRLLVATQADGHFENDDGHNDGVLIFAFRKQRKIDRMISILGKLEIPYSRYSTPSSPTETRIRIARRDVPSWLTPERKVFGAWLLDSTEGARKAFVEEVLLWDGHKGTTWGFPCNEYSSSIRENVEWVATMCHLADCSVGKIQTRPPHGRSGANYRLSIKYRGYAFISGKHTGEVKSSPVVYCPTTETGYFMFRYRDTIAVSGNTGRITASSERNSGTESTSSRFNPLNIPKKPVFGVDIRGMLVPRKGYKFVIFDYAQVEARVVQWLAGNDELLDMIRKENIYQATAKQLGWYPMNKWDLKGDDKPTYELAKRAALGAGYGMGDEKFQKTCAQYGVFISGEKSKETIVTWREKNPQVVNLWRYHHASLRVSAQRHDGQHTILLPSWRKLTYFGPEEKLGYRVFKNEETGKMESKEIQELFAAVWLHREKTKLYGGKIVENLTQSTARDIMYAAQIKISSEHPDWTFLWNAYDEVVYEVPDAQAKDASREIAYWMCNAAEWAKGCPLEVEGIEGINGVKDGICDRYMK